MRARERLAKAMNGPCLIERVKDEGALFIVEPLTVVPLSTLTNPHRKTILPSAWGKEA